MMAVMGELHSWRKAEIEEKEEDYVPVDLSNVK